MSEDRRQKTDNRQQTSDPSAGSGQAERRILTRENLIALAICLMLIAIIVLTSDSSPQWIYQGF
jgi:hypothetical protein